MFKMYSVTFKYNIIIITIMLANTSIMPHNNHFFFCDENI